MKVLLAAGGTGGHLFPGLATARALRDRGHHVHLVGKRDPKAQALIAREGFPSTGFYFEGLPRQLSWGSLVWPFKLFAAGACARRVLKRETPDVFLGMGGYVSVPVGLAARWARVPLVLHEQNVQAGLANRFLSRWAKTVAVSFEGTRGLSVSPDRVFQTGLPLRPEISPKDHRASRLLLGLDPDRPTLLVFGGSQGARSLNKWVSESFVGADPAWQVIHFPGKKDESTVREVYARTGRRAFVQGFWDDMATAYSAADFVVARSGANTVLEIQRMGKRALLIPYPHATDDHQTANARAMERWGNFTVLPESRFTANALVSVLASLPPPSVLRDEGTDRLSHLPPSLLTAADRLADAVEKTAMDFPPLKKGGQGGFDFNLL